MLSNMRFWFLLMLANLCVAIALRWPVINAILVIGNSLYVIYLGWRCLKNA